MEHAQPEGLGKISPNATVKLMTHFGDNHNRFRSDMHVRQTDNRDLKILGRRRERVRDLTARF